MLMAALEQLRRNLRRSWRRNRRRYRRMPAPGS